MSVTSRRLQTSYPPKQISHVSSETTTLVRRQHCPKPYLLTLVFTVITEQVAGGIVVPGSGRLIACLGVDDLVIVDMPDTLLVTTRARSQEVKRLVKKVRETGWKHVL